MATRKYPRLTWKRRAEIASAIIALCDEGLEDYENAYYVQMADAIQGLDTWPKRGPV